MKSRVFFVKIGEKNDEKKLKKANLRVLTKKVDFLMIFEILLLKIEFGAVQKSADLVDLGKP